MTLCWNDPNFGNEARGPALRAAAEAHGGLYTVWLTRPFDGAFARQVAIESGCSGIILEGEIPGHRPEAVNWAEVDLMLKDLKVPGTNTKLPLAVATNFAPFVHDDGSPWPEKARPLVEGGWACLTEAYDMGQTGIPPALWPAERAQFARHLGWHETQPILGIYGPPGGGGSLDAFPTRHSYRNWSIWDAGAAF